MGEFNVDKTTGGLEQTAGMPSEYPATQVMLSDGVTSVEDALFTIDTASTGSSTWSSGTSAVVEIDVSKTGYVPKGIITIFKSGANNGYVCICGFYIDETTQKARITMYNPSSTSVTVTGIQVTVLYAKA